MDFGALYRLTKPGVTYGNLITTVAGYLFAAQGLIDWQLFSGLTVGTWFVIASACVINNYLDQDIDAQMDRTKNRPLLTGAVTGIQAVWFGVSLGVTGTTLLILLTNWWVASLGIFGWVVYVWFYGALGKRLSMHGTLVGAISGAIPILAGYLAVHPGLSWTGLTLFFILFFWQMPEFYAISIFRKKEYAKAGVPVISVTAGVPHTTKHILFYTVAFVFSSLALFETGHASYVYLASMTILGMRWLLLARDGLGSSVPESWARSMFRFSLVVLLAFCVLISVDNFLP